jgi:hypothetical protein
MKSESSVEDVYKLEVTYVLGDSVGICCCPSIFSISSNSLGFVHRDSLVSTL